MRQEALAYFSPELDRLPVTSAHTNDEYSKIVQKTRSARWRGKAWRAGGKGGRKEVSGGLAAYQRVQRLNESWAPPKRDAL